MSRLSGLAGGGVGRRPDAALAGDLGPQFVQLDEVVGLAKGKYEERASDPLKLVDTRIANAVRCVPPQNKPEPGEINTCRQFLLSELAVLPKVTVILALGKIAHDSTLKTLGARIAAHPFKHGVAYDMGRFKLISSYHCSRYNTNTGVLTTPMFEKVVQDARKLAGL